MTFCGFIHSEVVSTKEELRNSSLVNTAHITLKMSIFCRQFQDRLFGGVPVMEGSLTTVGELWAEHMVIGSILTPSPRPELGTCTFLTVFKSLKCVHILFGILPLDFKSKKCQSA